MSRSAAGTALSGHLDGTLTVWDAATGVAMETLWGHTDVVESVAWGSGTDEIHSASADGTVKSWRLGASPGADGWLRLWSLDSGEEVRRIRTGSPSLECAVFSRDGSKVIGGGEDGRLGIWEAATGRELASISASSGPILAVALSPDESRLLAAGGRSIGLWDTGSRQHVLSLRGHQSLVYAVAFHPDGTQIATGGGGWVGEGCQVRLWGRVPGQTWPPDTQRVGAGQAPAD